MISRHHRMIFVHVPKCAGMAVELALGGLPEPQRTEQHFTGFQYRQYHSALWESYERFALVRDPICRCLSFVRFYRRWDAVWRRHLRGVPDEVLLRDLLMSVNLLTSHSAHRMLTGQETILKMEELSTAWPEFAEPRGLPAELPRHNASPRPTRREQVSPATQLMIAARFPEDFTRFGYALPEHDPADLPEAEQGALLWVKLRHWAMQHQGAPPEQALAALDAWAQQIPEPLWRERWEEMVQQRPPPLTPRGNLVLWTEERQDEVRAALGLPLWEPWSPTS